MNSQAMTADRFERWRREMVETDLRGRGITDARVLEAMARVPREAFVPGPLVDEAYDDRPLPIGQSQTISQPYTVAFMAQALQLRGTERVLEIGTGSGYGAAVLAQLASEVFTIERIATLAETARQCLRQQGYDNVQVVIGDGSRGLPELAPYDAIIVTAAARTLPPAYVQQLVPGGRIVIPLGEDRTSQRMYRFTCTAEGLTSENLGGFSFVPLIGEAGWNDDAAE